MAKDPGEASGQVAVTLPSGFSVSVPVPPGACLRDIRLEAHRLLGTSGSSLKLMDGDRILEDDDEPAEKHLPGPWQAVLCHGRRELIQQARQCRQEGRYEDMLSQMHAVAELGQPMALDECELLRDAVVACIDAVRTSPLAGRTRGGALDEQQAESAQRIRKISEGTLSVIQEHMMPLIEGDRAKLCCAALRAELHRYLAESAQGDERQRAVAKASALYTRTLAEAEMCLSAADPVRLGLCLSMSRFLYEVADDRPTAILVARDAFDLAICWPAVDCLEQAVAESSLGILQSIRASLTIWTDGA